MLCITGVGTLLSVAALRDVVAAIRDGRLPDAGGGYAYSYATLTEDNWMTLALTHLGYRVISPKDATMSTEVMLTWQELARQRLRWKRGAIEDLLSFGFSRRTLKGWTLQLVSAAGRPGLDRLPRHAAGLAVAGLPPAGWRSWPSP